MKVNLITNWNEQKGLWRDGCILERLLVAWGHQSVRVQYTDRQRPHPADLNIFLETLRPDYFSLAPVNWWVPNPEWARPEDLATLTHIDRVACKTREAEHLFTPLTDRAVYIGFESEDRYDPSVLREAKVLHIAGGSILKGTQAILAAWERYRLPYPLTVVGDEQTVKPRQIANVTYQRERLPDEELKAFQNSHMIHLCPSEAEGWGHTLYEAMSVNATILTTDRLTEGLDLPPGVPTIPHGTRCLATLYRVEPEMIAYGINLLCAAPAGLYQPRAQFFANREQFRGRLKALLPHS